MPNGSNTPIIWEKTTSTYRSMTFTWYFCYLNDMLLEGGLQLGTNGLLRPYQTRMPNGSDTWSGILIWETASQEISILAVPALIVNNSELINRVKSFMIDFTDAPSPLNARSDYILWPDPKASPRFTFPVPILAQSALPTGWTENDTEEPHARLYHNFAADTFYSIPEDEGVQRVIMTKTEAHARWRSGSAGSSMSESLLGASSPFFGITKGILNTPMASTLPEGNVPTSAGGWSDISSGTGSSVHYDWVASYNDDPTYDLSDITLGHRIVWLGPDAPSPTVTAGSVVDSFVDGTYSNITWQLVRTETPTPLSAGDNSWPGSQALYATWDGGSSEDFWENSPLVTSEYFDTRLLLLVIWDNSVMYPARPAYTTATEGGGAVKGGYVPQT